MASQSEVAAQANRLVGRVVRGLGQLQQVGGGIGSAPPTEDANGRRVDLGVGVVDSSADGSQGGSSTDRTTEHAEQGALLRGRRLSEAGLHLADAGFGLGCLEADGAYSLLGGFQVLGTLCLSQQIEHSR